MTKRIGTIVLALLTIANIASAIGLDFSEQKPVNSSAIENRLKREPDPSFSLLDSLTVDLNSRGYLDAAFVVRNGRLTLNSGARYTLSQISFFDNDTTVQSLSIPFDSSLVTQVLDDHLQIYRDSGFHYITAQSENIEINESSVILTVRLNKGPRVNQGELLFAGLNRTDKDLVKKYIPENEDKIVTADYINKVERAASQILFVKFSPPVNLQPRPGYTVSDIVFNFVEKTPVRLTGAAGLSGRDNKDVVWSLGLSFNNLFGQGKQVDINSQRIDLNRRTLSVGYSQPLFLIGLGDFGVNINTRDYRDQFYEFALSTSYQTRLNDNFTTGVRFGWKSVKPESGKTGYNSYRGEFSISRQTFSDNFNPENGLALKWNIEFGFRNYTAAQLPANISSRTFNETRNTINVSYYQKLAGPLVGHLDLNYAGLETSESLPPLSELILVGGPGTLRGYRNEQFAAVRTAFGTFEPRIRFNSGYIFLFYDAAYLNNRVNGLNNEIVTDEQFRWSYGLGFGLGDGRRNLSLSFGLNPEFGFDEPRLSIELSSDL